MPSDNETARARATRQYNTMVRVWLDFIYWKRMRTMLKSEVIRTRHLTL